MTTSSIIQFPCQFPIKVIGYNNDKFYDHVHDVFQTHFPQLNKKDIKLRLSRDKKYLAASVTIEATNQETLDQIYRELSGYSETIMTL